MQLDRRVAVGELEGVAQNVDNHLLEPVAVTEHIQEMLLEYRGHLNRDFLFFRVVADDCPRTRQHIVEREVVLVQLELILVDLSKVQKVHHEVLHKTGHVLAHAKLLLDFGRDYHQVLHFFIHALNHGQKVDREKFPALLVRFFVIMIANFS